MANTPKAGHHNGHQNIPTGAERVRSGFDRRKNWGDSVENVYRRIDSRLTELVKDGTEKGKAVRKDAQAYTEKYPLRIMAACLAAGLLLGIIAVRGRK